MNEDAYMYAVNVMFGSTEYHAALAICEARRLDPFESVVRGYNWMPAWQAICYEAYLLRVAAGVRT